MKNMHCTIVNSYISLNSNTKLYVCLFLFSLILFSPAFLKAQVKVVKNALLSNPTLKFNPIQGDSKISNAIYNDLKNCGWFNLTNDTNADYTLKGTCSSSNLIINLSKDTPFLRFQIPPSKTNPYKTAHQAVDYILKKLFNIKQLCTSKIAFCASLGKRKKELFMCNFDGSNPIQLTHNNTLSVEPDWEPGYKRLLYTLYNKASTDIIEYDLASKRSRRLINFKGLNTGATVSPDRHYFAVILSKDGSVDLYVKSIETKMIKRLTKNRASESSPCWSPSGAKLCFVSDLKGHPGLYTINATGQGLRRLKTLGTEAVSPDWSNDNKIVYSAKMGTNYSLAILDLKTGNSKIITNAAGNWEHPSWAPDARHIVVTGDMKGRKNLYIVDAKSGRINGLLSGKYDFSMPSW